MSKKVYGLKHATNKMKYHHMNYMMDFKARLRETTNTDEALALIRVLMGGTEDGRGTEEYHNWFNKVYDNYRSDREQYDREIFAKLNELTDKNWLDDDPRTEDEKALDEWQAEADDWRSILIG